MKTLFLCIPLLLLNVAIIFPMHNVKWQTERPKHICCCHTLRRARHHAQYYAPKHVFHFLNFTNSHYRCFYLLHCGIVCACGDLQQYDEFPCSLMSLRCCFLFFNFFIALCICISTSIARNMFHNRRTHTLSISLACAALSAKAAWSILGI